MAAKSEREKGPVMDSLSPPPMTPQQQRPPSPSPPSPMPPQPPTEIPSPPLQDDPPSPRPRFDPSRMIGIIRRKGLIKDLAAVYHAECLSYCQELLELQRKWEEQPHPDIKSPEDLRKETMRPLKRIKKSR